MPMDLDLNLLLALDKLLEGGSVTRAADALGITQPAMSRTLQRLREALGDPLLVRVGRGMVLTDRARALAEPVREALRAAERVFAPPEDFDPATARGGLAIALGDEAQVAFVAAIARTLREQAPGIDLRVHPLSAASLDDGRRGVIDLALAPDLTPLPRSAGGVDYDDFVARELYPRRFVVCAAAGTPVMDLETWLGARHVIVGFAGGGRGFLDDILEAHGLRRRVAATVTSFPSAAALIARSELVGLLPEELLWTTGRALTAWAPPVPVPELRMLLLWHPRRSADARHRFLRELVARTVRAEVATWARTRAVDDPGICG